MVSGPLTSLPTNGSQALLFTDARGHVVFVDNNFLKLVRRAQAGRIVGEPLHSVMGIEPDVAAQLLRDTSQLGSFSDRLLDLRVETGTLVQVSCSSVATYDDRKAFIGADMTLLEVARASAPEPGLSEDALAAAHAADQRAVLTVYFLSVLHSLRDLVTRVGGDRLRQRLDVIINETARRADWPVLIQAGKVYTEVHKNEGEIYRGLLAKAITYAGGVIGDELVNRTLAHVDEQANPATLELADQFGLRELIHSSQ